MPRYDVPIWATDDAPFPPAGISGAGWKLTAPEVLLEPGSTYLTKHFRRMRKKYPQYATTHLSDGRGPGRIAPQLLLEAPSRIAAQRAFGLLQAAVAAMDGHAGFEIEDAIVVPADRRKLEDLSEYDVMAASSHIMARRSVLLASKLAAKLSRSAPMQYAAFKLQLSYRIASAHHTEVSPTYFRKRFGISKARVDHVTMASAVTLAYSAIEEMQLEPRPHGKRPVMKDGVWDEESYRDLRQRLDRAGVRSAAPVIWNVRGTPTRVHRAERAPKGERMSWTKGQVRDRGVSVEDALLAASWLRSRCTTHKFGKATTSISMFDVFNVQSLTRRLMLERTGIWEDILPNAGPVRRARKSRESRKRSDPVTPGEGSAQ
jgi:hypothetical protein